MAEQDKSSGGSQADSESNTSRVSDAGTSISSISGRTLEKAKAELHEDPETREDVIQELRGLVVQWKPVTVEEKALVFRNTNSAFLLMFLRARKFDVDKALLLYISYHVFRHRHAQLLKDLTQESVEHVFQSNVFKVLDMRAEDGSKVLCVYPRNWNASMHPFLENFRATFLVLDKLIQDEETQVHGFSILYDFTDSSIMSMLHVAQSELITRGILIELLQDAFPARFKGVHLVHQPWYINIVLGVIKPFMKQKLRDRIHSHGEDYDSLHRHIDPQGLPDEFGGLMDSSTAVDVISTLF